MSTHLRKKVFFFVVGIIALLSLVIFIRFVFGGDEDVWTCKDNKWVAHGKPSYQKPNDPCGKKVVLPKNQKDCLIIGGIWKKLGPDPFETCNIKATDRGTICTDSSECEGLCQADMTPNQMKQGMKGKVRKGKGRCSVWRVELGCMGVVESGMMKVLCID